MHGWSNEREQENLYHACSICDFFLVKAVTVLADRGFSSEKYNHHANLGKAEGKEPPEKWKR